MLGLEVSRRERFLVELELKQEEITEEDQKIVNDIFQQTLGRTAPGYKGDTFNFNFGFDIEYFGTVDQQLEWCLGLIERAAIVKVSTEELRQGRCLIQEILVRFEELERKYRARRRRR